MGQLKSSAQAVQNALSAAGLTLRVTELPASTRSAKEAANAVGCTVAEIAKSIVFKTKDTERAILVIASGKNRVNEAKIAIHIQENLEQASPDFVRRQTGFAIGGVPPCAHRNELTTFIDEDLLKFEVIWAAAGTPNAVFPITPEDLVRLCRGKTVDVS